MPTDQFKLSAQWSTKPQDGALLLSGAVPIGPTPISEYLTLAQKNLDQYALSADGAQAVAFAGVTTANVVIITSDRPISVIITSSLGTSQVIPCDDQLIIVSRTNGVTALSVQRTPATPTNVSVFIGQSA